MTIDNAIHTGIPGTRRTGMVTYATACTAIVAIVFLTNWPTYQYAVRGGPIPLYFYMLPVAMIAPLIFAEPGNSVRFMREPMFWWFVAFVGTGLIWLLPAQDFIEDASRQWRLRVHGLMFFYTVTILAADANRRTLGWVIAGCVILACAFNWFDVLRPNRFVPRGLEGDSDRGAGLFMNPNAAASFVVIGTIAALPLIARRLRSLLLVAAVFGVAATFSRSGFVLITVTILAVIALKLVSRMQRIMLIVGVPLLIGGVSLSYDYLVDASDNRQMHNVIQRLAWFQDMDEEDSAVEGRKFGAAQAWRQFLDSPVTGRGTGATSLAVRQEGPHNMYLLLMAEQGVLGLFLYVTLLGILFRQGWRLARAAAAEPDKDVGRMLMLFSLFMTAYGFFSHNVLEEPHTLFLVAFVVAIGVQVSRAGHRVPPAVTQRFAVRRVTPSA